MTTDQICVLFSRNPLSLEKMLGKCRGSSSIDAHPRRATTATRTTGPAVRTAMNDRTNRAAPAAPAADAAKGKKRPAWDTKGRLEDMEALMKKTSSRVAALESQNTELKTNVEEKETVVIQNTEELNNLKNEKGNLESEVSTSGISRYCHHSSHQERLRTISTFRSFRSLG